MDTFLLEEMFRLYTVKSMLQGDPEFKWDSVLRDDPYKYIVELIYANDINVLPGESPYYQYLRSEIFNRPEYQDLDINRDIDLYSYCHAG